MSYSTFKQKKLLIKFLLCSLTTSIFCTLHAQNVTFLGRVIDSANSTAVEGASITLKGLNAGTITDANGNFKITAPRVATLVVNSVSYAKREVITVNSLFLTIAMPPTYLELTVLFQAIQYRVIKGNLGQAE